MRHLPIFWVAGYGHILDENLISFRLDNIKVPDFHSGFRDEGSFHLVGVSIRSAEDSKVVVRKSERNANRRKEKIASLHWAALDKI